MVSAASCSSCELWEFPFFAILCFDHDWCEDQKTRRDSWHHGGWGGLKMIAWFLLVVLMFFVPNVIVSIYGTLSKFGAGAFLLVQVVHRSVYINRVLHCYNAFSGILFIWFNPSGQDCGLNVFFIVVPMILAFVFAIIALHPAVNGSLLPASVISVYCAYVCYTGLSSDRMTMFCNGLNKSKAVNASTLILGMLTTVLSVLYSALRAALPPHSSHHHLPPDQVLHQSLQYVWHWVLGVKESLLEDPEDGRRRVVKQSTACELLNFLLHIIFALANVRCNASLGMD
ncbi:unnamed protein product [Arabidopsis arenosa]|uniref:Uncharacterized protein n=1 Tax=Arabidopsis arenosa TaxID=38785 RepID=A0A8S1ZRQ6_ARAAE|nr:unnamed protein product [Arabidopsis arenosa]